MKQHYTLLITLISIVGTSNAMQSSIAYDGSKSRVCFELTFGQGQGRRMVEQPEAKPTHAQGTRTGYRVEPHNERTVSIRTGYKDPERVDTPCRKRSFTNDDEEVLQSPYPQEPEASTERTVRRKCIKPETTKAGLPTASLEDLCNALTDNTHLAQRYMHGLEELTFVEIDTAKNKETHEVITVLIFTAKVNLKSAANDASTTNHIELKLKHKEAIIERLGGCLKILIDSVLNTREVKVKRELIVVNVTCTFI